MKNLIILLMLVSSAVAQEPVKIKLLIPNEDWAKVCQVMTRVMGTPITQGTEVITGPRQFSDGTEVSHGERTVYRQRSWINGTIAVWARIKVATETEAIEVAVTVN